MRFGIKPPLVTGMLLVAVALLLFARVPVDGNYAIDLLPGMILLGLGAGIGFNPVFLAAMSDVAPEESGLASGVVNTAFMMGGALGLAVLASLATRRADSLAASGHSNLAALTGGYHVAFLLAAIFSVASAAVGGTLLRVGQQQAPAHEAGGETTGAVAAAEAD
jgi:MFS family permease